MKTNDLRSGMRVKLANGWFAIIRDNKRGNIRLAEVQGTYTEIGSVYAHDIMEYLPEEGDPVPITHTADQRRLRTTAATFL